MAQCSLSPSLILVAMNRPKKTQQEEEEEEEEEEERQRAA